MGDGGDAGIPMVSDPPWKDHEYALILWSPSPGLSVIFGIVVPGQRFGRARNC